MKAVWVPAGPAGMTRVGVVFIAIPLLLGAALLATELVLVTFPRARLKVSSFKWELCLWPPGLSGALRRSRVFSGLTEQLQGCRVVAGGCDGGVLQTALELVHEGPVATSGAEAIGFDLEELRAQTVRFCESRVWRAAAPPLAALEYVAARVNHFLDESPGRGRPGGRTVPENDVAVTPAGAAAPPCAEVSAALASAPAADGAGAVLRGTCHPLARPWRIVPHLPVAGTAVGAVPITSDGLLVPESLKRGGGGGGGGGGVAAGACIRIPCVWRGSWMAGVWMLATAAAAQLLTSLLEDSRWLCDGAERTASCRPGAAACAPPHGASHSGVCVGAGHATHLGWDLLPAAFLLTVYPLVFHMVLSDSNLWLQGGRWAWEPALVQRVLAMPWLRAARALCCPVHWNALRAAAPGARQLEGSLADVTGARVSCLAVQFRGASQPVAIALDAAQRVGPPVAAKLADASDEPCGHLVPVPWGRPDIAEAVAAAVNRHMLAASGSVAADDSDQWPPVLADLSFAFDPTAAATQRAAVVAANTWDRGRWRSGGGSGGGDAATARPPACAVTAALDPEDSEILRLALAPRARRMSVALAAKVAAALAYMVAIFPAVLAALPASVAGAVAAAALLAIYVAVIAWALAVLLIPPRAQLQIGRQEWRLAGRLDMSLASARTRGATSDLAGAEVRHRTVAWSGEVRTELLLHAGGGAVHEIGQSLTLQEQLYAAWEINRHLEQLVPADGQPASP